MVEKVEPRMTEIISNNSDWQSDTRRALVQVGGPGSNTIRRKINFNVLGGTKKMTTKYNLVKEEDKSFDADYAICHRIRYNERRPFGISVYDNELTIEMVTIDG